MRIIIIFVAFGMYLSTCADSKPNNSKNNQETTKNDAPAAAKMDAKEFIFPFGLNLSNGFEVEKKPKVSAGDCDSQVSIYKNSNAVQVIVRHIDCFDYGTIAESTLLENGSVKAIHKKRHYPEFKDGKLLKITKEMVYLSSQKGSFELYTRADTLEKVENFPELSMEFSKVDTSGISAQDMIQTFQLSDYLTK